MTQNEALVEHLLLGKTITPAKARQVYGIDRLAARIFELKARGHKIITTVRRDERGKQFGEYRLRTLDRFGKPKKVS